MWTQWGDGVLVFSFSSSNLPPAQPNKPLLDSRVLEQVKPTVSRSGRGKDFQQVFYLRDKRPPGPGQEENSPSVLG